MVTKPQGAFERGFDGQVGWEKTARGVREITGGELATFKAGNGLFALISLKDQYAGPSSARRAKIGDPDVYATDGALPDGKRLRIYFETVRGVLLPLPTFARALLRTFADL